MSFSKHSDDFNLERQHQAFIHLVRLFDTEQALCDAYNTKVKSGEKKLSRQRVNHLKNGIQKTPYEVALTLSQVSPLMPWEIAPCAQGKNEILMAGINQWPCDRIRVLDALYDPVDWIQSVILIDSEGVLISGLATLKAYQAQGKKKIPALIIRLKALIEALKSPARYRLLSAFSLQNFDFVFSMSQQMAISLAFHRLSVDQKEWHSDRKLGEHLARVFGFESHALMLLAHNLYLKAPAYWMEALDRKVLSMEEAIQLLEHPEKQCVFEETHGSFLKAVRRLDSDVLRNTPSSILKQRDAVQSHSKRSTLHESTHTHG